jgi:hypothetical protein
LKGETPRLVPVLVPVFRQHAGRLRLSSIVERQAGREATGRHHRNILVICCSVLLSIMSRRCTYCNYLVDRLPRRQVDRACRWKWFMCINPAIRVQLYANRHEERYRTHFAKEKSALCKDSDTARSQVGWCKQKQTRQKKKMGLSYRGLV